MYIGTSQQQLGVIAGIDAVGIAAPYAFEPAGYADTTLVVIQVEINLSGSDERADVVGIIFKRGEILRHPFDRSVGMNGARADEHHQQERKQV